MTTAQRTVSAGFGVSLGRIHISLGADFDFAQLAELLARQEVEG